jgi:hypothetical protein
VNQQGSEIGVATFTDIQQVLFATAGMLLGHQAQPCGDLTAAVKVLRIPQRSHQRAGGDGANARDLCQFATGITLAMPFHDLRLQVIDLTVELLQMIQQSLYEYSK